MAKLLGEQNTGTAEVQAPAPTKTPKRRSIRAKLAILGVLALASLGVYLGVSPSKPSQAARISHLESITKCPDCISVSTKDANTASAHALRSFITQMVHQGASDTQIIDQLVATYGPSVLLVPPGSNGGMALAGAGLVLVLGIPAGGILYYRRRSRKPRPEPEESETAPEPMARATEKERTKRGRIRSSIAAASLAQKLVAATGVALILGGGGLLGYGMIARQSTTLSAQQITTDLSAAEQLAAIGSDTQALQLFSAVLASNPKQPEALAWNGWLLRQAGHKDKSKALLSAGISQLHESVSIQPGYLYGRLFYGISLWEDNHDAAGAVKQFKAYLALSPPKTLTKQVKSTIDAAYKADKLPAPL